MPAPIRIVKFWTTYRKRNGETVPVDMVEYCAPGMAQRATTTAIVSQLAKVREDIDADNPAYLIARERWAAIGPAYEAWKKGHEVPVDGTPLAAWPGVTAEQADVLRSFGMRTVEEIAQATDSIIARVQLPGMREMQTQARAYLDSADQVRVSEDLARKDRELAELRDQLEEMRQIVLAAQAEADPDLEADGSEAPRRRGRPPKVRDIEAA